MTTQTKSTTDPKALHARLLSIRVQLLVITSSVILFFVAVLVTLDYRREIHHHFQEKHADLIDEARTILPGVLHLRNHGNDVVQKYIDRICLRMDDENSPEHHIAVSINEDQLLHADSSHPISRDLCPRSLPLPRAILSISSLKTKIC